ncbi:MAG: SDR family NAD(P)-dependent oxidoreductase [Chloroflexota bacterium]
MIDSSHEQVPIAQPISSRSDRPLEPHARVIVIGASSGIGAALVRNLARKGCYVAAVARRADLLQKLSESINAASPNGGRVFSYVHDVTHYDEIPTLFEQIVTDLSGVDVVIYNAGVMYAIDPAEYDFDKDRRQIEVNLLGAIAWLNMAANRFQQLNTGQIVGISSVAGDRGRRNNPTYQTAKGGLSIFLESLRNRLSQNGVNVTTIKPGFVKTDMLANATRTTGAITAEAAADQIVAAIERKRQVVYVPGWWRFVMLTIKSIPSFIFRRLNI